jgi:hypothetical protein
MTQEEENMTTNRIRKWMALSIVILLAGSAFALNACSSSNEEMIDNTSGTEQITPSQPVPDREQLSPDLSDGFEKIVTPVEIVIPGEGNLGRSEVTIDGSEVVKMKNSPSGYGLRILGTKPTPCHQVQVDFKDPDKEGVIFADVYATSEPDLACIQVIEAFDKTFALEVFNPIENSVLIISGNTESPDR